MTDGWADPADVAAHYSRRLTLETDCADVGAHLAAGTAEFVLVDVRSAEAYKEGHLPGAVHIHHSDMTIQRMSEYPTDTRFVVYCWGPHCNGATKGAECLGRLGYSAKEMIGGVWGWGMEGFELESSS